MSAGKKRGKELETLAHSLGWQKIGTTGANHMKWKHPKTGQMVCLAVTPSDVRGFYNSRSLLRRLSKQVRPTRKEKL